MKTILIDTSTETMFIIFYDEDKEQRILYKEKETHNNHSENIIDELSSGLKETGMKLSDFGKVVIGSGPGSYTGLRVGMTVAKMIAFCCRISLYTVGSLLFIGSGYFRKDGCYAVCNRAKKNCCHGRIVKTEGGAVKEKGKDAFMTDAEFIALSEMERATVIGSGSYLIDEKFIIGESIKADIHTAVPDYLRKVNG